MSETNEVVLEAEFTTDSSKIIDITADGNSDKNQVTVKLLDQTSFDRLKTLNFKQVLGDQIAPINYDGLEKFLSSEGCGEALVIEQDEKILGFCGVFYEYSDWKNSLLYYIYDVRVNEAVGADHTETITGVIMDEVTRAYKDKKARGVKLLFKNEEQWVKPLMKKIGFVESHYVIYEVIL